MTELFVTTTTDAGGQATVLVPGVGTPTRSNGGER